MPRYGTRLNGGDGPADSWFSRWQQRQAAEPDLGNVGDLWGALRGQSTTMQVHEQQAVSGVEDNRETARRLMGRLAEQGIISGDDWNRLQQISEEGQEQKQSLWSRVLGWLDRPGQLVRYAIADVFDIGEAEHITRTAYSDILTGNTKDLLERYGEDVVGEDARMSGSQMLELMGNEQATTGWGKFGRGLLSFGLELGTDPLTYVGFGGLGASKEVIGRTAIEVLEQATEAGLSGAIRGGGRAAALAVRQAERARSLLPEAEALIAKRGAKELADDADSVLRQILQEGGDEAADTAMRVAKRMAVNQAGDEIIPQLLARKWGAAEVADFVRYSGTPAYLRGGIHLSPLPLLGQRAEKALTLPGSRGTGKWVTQHLLGKASSVMGQKATGFRALIENISPLYHSWEAFTTRFDAGAWIRAAQKGEESATGLIRATALVRKVRSREAATNMMAHIGRLHERLMDTAEAAHLPADKIDRLTSRLVTALFERTVHMSPDGIRSEVMRTLDEAGLPPAGLADALTAYADGWHTLFRDRRERGIRFKVLPGNTNWSGVPVVPTHKGSLLLDDLIEHGATAEGDDVWAQTFNLLAGHRRLRSLSGGVVGEAGHAQERTLGAHVVPLTAKDGTVMLDLNGLIDKMPAATREELYRQLGANAQRAAGVPAFNSVVELDERLTEIAVDLARRTPGVRVPTKSELKDLHLFETHPIRVASAYLADVNAAIVERAVMEHLADLGLVSRALTRTNYREMGYRTARILNPDSGGEWGEHTADNCVRLNKGEERLDRMASRTVTVRQGGRSQEIPEMAATPKIMEDLQAPLKALDGGDAMWRRQQELADDLFRRLTKDGVGEDEAQAVLSATDLAGVRQLADDMARTAMVNARAATQTMLDAAVRGEAGLADVARLRAVLDAELDEVVEQTRRKASEVAGRFRRRHEVSHQDAHLGDELRADVTDAAYGTVEEAQRLIRGQQGEAAEAILHATALAADRNATVQSLSEAAGTLDELISAQWGRMGAEGAEEALVRAAVRRLAVKGGRAEQLAEQAADLLATGKDGLRRAVRLLEEQAPTDVIEQATLETLLVRGLPDLAGATLDVAADLGGLRDSVELLRWLRSPNRAGLATRRINRALLAGANMAPDTTVHWVRDADGLFVPSFRSAVRVGRGASYGQVGRELRKVGLPAEEARRLLKAGEETAETAALSREVREALLHANDEGAGLMDEWIRLGEKRALLDRLRTQGAGTLTAVPDPRVSSLRGVGRSTFAARIGTIRKLPVGWRRGDKLGNASARQLGLTIGDRLPQPTARQLDGARLFMSEGDRAGFGVAADGEIFGLFNTEGKGAGLALLQRAQAEGGTWAMVPKDHRARHLFERAGMVAGLGDRMQVLPARFAEMADLAATHTAQRQILEQVSDALTEGRLDDVERMLHDRGARRLLAEFPEQRDLLLDHVKAVRALRDPDLPRSMKEMVKERQHLLAGTVNRERALETLAAVDRQLREWTRAKVSAPWREALEAADGFVRSLAALQDNLARSKPLLEGAEKELADNMIADVIGHARRGGWEKEAKALEAALKDSSTFVPPKGRVMFRAYALSGRVVEYSASKPSVALIMENLVSQLQTMSSPAGLRYLSHQARSVEEWWKGMATVARPTFHVRNLVGGVFNNMIGDVRVRDYLWVRDKFARLRHAQSKGMSVPEAIAKVAKTEKDRKILTAIWENEVLESSFSSTLADRLARETDTPLRRKLYPLGRSGPLVKAGSFTMGTIEDFLRASCFKRWYDDLGEQAATAWTFSLHFDYKNLGHLERAIKTVVPFFVWTRRNMPLQMRVLVERPDLVQRYAHLMHGFNEDADPNSPYDMPMGPSNGLSIGTGMVFNADTPFWARLIVSPDVPLSDLGNIDDPKSLGSWMRFLTSTLGPAVQVPFKLAQGEEYGGQVNAPAGLNEILLGLHALGMYDEVYDGAARIPRNVRSIGEAIIPAWSEYARPWETDPSRRQALGLGGQRDAMSMDVLRAAGLHMVGRGVGMRTQTPSMAYSNALSTNDFLSSLEYELEHQGVIPSNSPLLDEARQAQLAGLLPDWP